MKILEELWYGKIEPTEYGASPSQEYRALRRLVDRNETDLRATMTDAQKELFTRYLESVLEYQTLSELMLLSIPREIEHRHRAN